MPRPPSDPLSQLPVSDADLKLSRRHALLGTAAAGALAWAGSLPITIEAAAQGQRVIRVAESTIGDSDPHRPVDFPGSILMLNLYDYLVEAQPGGKIGPSVARSWTISPDGITYQFELRNDVKFHDGKLLTAKDVVFSVNRILAIKRGFSFLFTAVKSVEETGPHSVKITLTRAFAPFLGGLVRLAIVNRDLVLANKKDGSFGDNGDYGQAFLSSNDAGSGAYKLTKHEAQQETLMEKFDGYFLGHAQNAADLVRLRFGVEQPTVRTMMARQELEVTRPPLSPEVLVALSRSRGVKLGLDKQPQLMNFKFNTQKAPTDDVNFRRAMALAYDYDQHYSLLEVAGMKSGIPANGPIPSGVMGYDPSVPVVKRDLAAAKAELAKSRYASNPPALNLDLVSMREVPQQDKYALLFQQSMAELGVKVNLVPTPWAQIQQMATSPESTAQVSIIYVGLTTPDVDSLLWAEYHSTSGGTYNAMEWLKDAEVDRLLEEGRLLIDPAQREQVYRRLAVRLRELRPALWVYERANVVALQDYLSAPGLQNIEQSVPVMAANYRFRTMSVGRSN